MLDLGGIKTPYRDDSQSVATPLYKMRPRVYLNEDVYKRQTQHVAITCRLQIPRSPYASHPRIYCKYSVI